MSVIFDGQLCSRSNDNVRRAISFWALISHRLEGENSDADCFNEVNSEVDSFKLNRLSPWTSLVQLLLHTGTDDNEDHRHRRHLTGRYHLPDAGITASSRFNHVVQNRVPVPGEIRVKVESTRQYPCDIPYYLFS